MKTQLDCYAPTDTIPVKTFLKHKKAAKYFNRETAAAVVCLGRLLEETSLAPDTPFYYAKGLVEYEEYGLESIVDNCRDEKGKFSTDNFVNKAMASLSPLTQFKVLFNMPLSFTAIEYGLTGDNAVLYASAGGLLSHALHAPEGLPVLLGTAVVYADGSVEAGFSLGYKEEYEALHLPEPDSDAIEFFRHLHHSLQQNEMKLQTDSKKGALPLKALGNPKTLSRKGCWPPEAQVVITAAGVQSPLGCSVPKFMQGLDGCASGLGRVVNFDTTSYPSDFGAEVRHKGEAVKTAPGTDRKALFIQKAVEELIANSPDFANYAPPKRLMHLGAGIDYFNLEGYVNSDNSRQGKWADHYYSSLDTVRDIARHYDIRGGTGTNVAACVASPQAMGLSFRILKNAPGQAVISGGFDSMLNHLSYMGFYKLGALADGDMDPKEACKPFDKNRGGLVLGEGAAVFLLQRADEVKANTILAEICGYSSYMDSYKVTDPHPEGRFLAQAALQAIEEAGITPDAIDCVHLHGTGTFKNALAEAQAMAAVFAGRFKEIPVFSLKAQVGHLIGACGAMEMLAVIYSLQKQVVPPTLNYASTDPEVPLRVITDKGLSIKINYILKLNSGFGGQNTALVVKRYGN
ncbi:MAG: beta-ketoacyl-[acyl-carrier-protein] synthase family protein [bacterium]|nr:beta-ketoacyl-[acyl-carrier-protein] synthase family protein [bacterium]